MAHNNKITKEQLYKMRKHAMREKYKAAGLLRLWMRQGQSIGKNKKAIESKNTCRKKVNFDE